MKWTKTDHSDGRKSITLIPENEEERQHLALALGTSPGGSKQDEDDRQRARIDVPVISNGKQTWPDDSGVGEPQLRDGVFTRRIALGYK